MMKTILIVCLVLYGIANLLAGGSDLFVVNQLPAYMAIFLVVSGILFLAAAHFGFRNRPVIFILTLAATLFAFGLAIYNERVLGLGLPVHHLFRGIFSLILISLSYILYRKWKPEAKLS
jgi:hypothetical protein